MSLLTDYIIALTHLYGLVHKKRVLNAYNRQNEIQCNLDDVTEIARSSKKMLAQHFVQVHGDYFVEDTILNEDEYEHELEMRQDKPWYLPDKESLLKYKDSHYYDISDEYTALSTYLAQTFYGGDEYKADILCEYIQGICQFAFSFDIVLDEFERRNLTFKSEDEMNEFIHLVAELANNTRIWQNNGFTPKELSEKFGQSAPGTLLHPSILSGTGQRIGPVALSKSVPNNVIPFKREEKAGRNDPCPCGSGKKYKQRCLSKS